jgi:release factor glutamine methyltransferase
MTTDYWLSTATRFLESKSIPTARLDCLVLLEDTLRIDRAQLLAEPTTEMSDAQVDHLKKLLTRRAHHVPLAYVRGRTEFYGRNFAVSEAVLEPRPESETMIELLKNLPIFGTSKISSGNSTDSGADGGVAAAASTKSNGELDASVSIADVGTGSGALGITAFLELPNVRVDLLDIDASALEVAKSNVDLFTISISVLQSDLLGRAVGPYDVLLCNLPYVPDDHMINRAASHEPKLAIYGGPDGLDLYRRLFEQVQSLQNRPLYILTEALPPQHEALARIALEADYSLAEADDFIQVFTSAAYPQEM